MKKKKQGRLKIRRRGRRSAGDGQESREMMERELYFSFNPAMDIWGLMMEK